MALESTPSRPWEHKPQVQATIQSLGQCISNQGGPSQLVVAVARRRRIIRSRLLSEINHC